VEFINLITVVFGAAPDAFLLVTLTVFCLVVTLRRCAQFHPETAQINHTEWGKALLTLLTILFGISMAFIAVSVDVYTTTNPIMVAWIGFWNGVLATTGWQFAKRFPVLRQFAEGFDRPTKP
jgi:heme/copper-type cytochrome/quinol oxidase subunit 2